MEVILESMTTSILVMIRTRIVLNPKGRPFRAHHNRSASPPVKRGRAIFLTTITTATISLMKDTAPNTMAIAKMPVSRLKHTKPIPTEARALPISSGGRYPVRWRFMNSVTRNPKKLSKRDRRLNIIVNLTMSAG